MAQFKGAILHLCQTTDLAMIHQKKLLPLVLFLPLSAHAQSDDFEDGNDSGWTRIDPIFLAGGGTTANFAFPAGA